ncbi:endonuclease I family protein [Neobacillus mesonae]|uniref:endonuclease I family protein n=1 Tax=Neobacillus mesonae TaxID=1193713 RepID=UPI00203B5FEA|nr:endonuclease [Neobacillus mesonae]MCM3570365.1 endonuclease [Neobacillus mesonae]
MAKKRKNVKKLWDTSSKFIPLHKQLIFLRENRRKIKIDKDLYFNERQNQMDIDLYYQSLSYLPSSGLELFYKYNSLLEKTHKNQIPYFISKDLYLYTWVDLYPDGTVKSIYSGEKKDPEALILHDYEIINQKYEEFQHYLEKVEQREYDLLKELKAFEKRVKLNTEHIVPQSWFGALEPMKGDLHHLFVCDPECNIARSNFPYKDFTFYQPESPDEPIQNHCGLAVKERFEPEFGKGAAARAMLYFILRYPKAIKKVHRQEIDVQMLLSWHKEFPVSLYEKHRNQAIFHIQGNRNPFIDLPEAAEKMEFPIGMF